MHTDRFICATSTIFDYGVYRNGERIFKSDSSGIAGFLDAIYRQREMAYPKFHKMDLLSKLGLLATDVLLNNEYGVKAYPRDQTAVILSNASASLDTDQKYVQTIANGASPALFVYTLPNIVIGEISIRHGFTGENAFFVFKHFDATFMQQYIDGLFDQQLILACIGGWLELIGETYHAFLFLVEKEAAPGSVPFTSANLNHLYISHHG